MLPRRPLSAVPAGLVALTVLLAACDESNPPTGLPATRDPGQVISLAPQVFLLRPDQLPAYQRTADDAVSAVTFAADEGDASLQATLEGQGFTSGARATYQRPGSDPTTAFRLVISEALVFRDSHGAANFFADEAKRRDKPPDSGGTVTTLTGLPSTGTDQMAAFSATGSPAIPGVASSAPQVYFVLLRRGRVVAEVVGGGDPGTATVAAFTDLVTTQQALLSTNPTI